MKLNRIDAFETSDGTKHLSKEVAIHHETRLRMEAIVTTAIGQRVIEPPRSVDELVDTLMNLRTLVARAVADETRPDYS